MAAATPSKKVKGCTSQFHQVWGDQDHRDEFDEEEDTDEDHEMSGAENLNGDGEDEHESEEGEQRSEDEEIDDAQHNVSY